MALAVSGRVSMSGCRFWEFGIRCRRQQRQMPSLLQVCISCNYCFLAQLKFQFSLNLAINVCGLYKQTVRYFFG